MDYEDDFSCMTCEGMIEDMREMQCSECREALEFGAAKAMKVDADRLGYDNAGGRLTKRFGRIACDYFDGAEASSEGAITRVIGRINAT